MSERVNPKRQSGGDLFLDFVGDYQERSVFKTLNTSIKGLCVKTLDTSFGRGCVFKTQDTFFETSCVN